MWPADSQNRLTGMILLIAVLAAVLFQGSRGLFSTTEGRYAEAAREMLASGNLLQPLLDGKPHLTKPPLTYLCIAGGLEVFGNNTWGARAYLVLSFVGTVVVVYLLAAEVWGKPVAPFCVLIYATAPFPLIASNIVSTDTLLAFWEALAMLFFWRALRRNSLREFQWMWLSLGLAVCTKGPAGLLPLLGGMLPVYFVLRRRGTVGARLFHPAGIVLFAVSAGGWYVWEEFLHPGYLRYWLIHETYGRLVLGEFHRNPQWHYALMYLPLLTVGMGPWGLFFLPHLRSIPWPKKAWFRWLSWPQGTEWTYVLLSVLVPSLLLSVCRSKLPLYVLPITVPLSLGWGRALFWLVESRRISSRTLLWTGCFVALVFVGVKAIYVEGSARHDMKRLTADLESIPPDAAGLPLYKVEDVYGLQFYRQEVIPYFDWPTATERLRSHRSRTARALLLIPAEDVAMARHRLGTDCQRIERVNNYWSVIEILVESQSVHIAQHAHPPQRGCPEHFAPP